jgi:hypothetical protein
MHDLLTILKVFSSVLLPLLKLPITMQKISICVNRIVQSKARISVFVSFVWQRGGSSISGIYRVQTNAETTHDNASYTVMSDFDVLGRKFGYQKQCRLNAFYSVQDIFINLFACLYLYVCPCCYLYYFGFPVFIDRDEQTNEWTKGRMNRRTAIPNIVYPSLRERVVKQ